jgi:hypothetical protein
LDRRWCPRRYGSDQLRWIRIAFKLFKLKLK